MVDFDISTKIYVKLISFSDSTEQNTITGYSIDFTSILPTPEDEDKALKDILPSPIVYIKSDIDPTVNDDTTIGIIESHIWINEEDDGVFICVDNSEGAAIWKEINFV